jgi:DUF1365 family protein
VRTASCIYEGTIRHRRRDPHRSLEHAIALFYLDLDELPSLLGGRLVQRRPGALRFRRRDYLGGDSVSLKEAVRARVAEATGIRPDGPIRVLTQLRSFGHCFNPVSFYYCFDRAGEGVEAVVAEVTNTPWRERHAYVIAGRAGELDKRLHVSPFMGMDHRYTVKAGKPGARLGVHIESHREGSVAFDATLALSRVELTGPSAARMARRYPLASARVLALIYAHAVGLKLAGASVYRHPGSGPRPHHVHRSESA